MAKILIIDDDPSVHASARSILESEGHDVTAVSSGWDGEKIFRNEDFLIVIVDLFMPEQDGIETIRRLRAARRSLKVLAVAERVGRGEPDFLAMSKALGADEVLEKPFTARRLLETVAVLRNVIWRSGSGRDAHRAGERAMQWSAIWRGGSSRAENKSGDHPMHWNVIWRGRSDRMAADASTLPANPVSPRPHLPGGLRPVNRGWPAWSRVYQRQRAHSHRPAWPAAGSRLSTRYRTDKRPAPGRVSHRGNAGEFRRYLISAWAAGRGRVSRWR